MDNRKAFNHNLLVRQDCSGVANYYAIDRSKGIVFHLSAYGNDIHFAFEDGIQHTPGTITRSMRIKLKYIWKHYLNDYSCYFEIM